MEMLIGGTRVSGKERIEVRNPATQELIDTVPAAGSEELELALQSAQEGFAEWSAKTILERNQILYRYAELVEEHREELQVLLCRENGKNIKNTGMEFDAVHALFTGYAEKAAHVCGNTLPAGNQKTSARGIWCSPVGSRWALWYVWSPSIFLWICTRKRRRRLWQRATR